MHRARSDALGRRPVVDHHRLLAIQILQEASIDGCSFIWIERLAPASQQAINLGIGETREIRAGGRVIELIDIVVWIRTTVPTKRQQVKVTLNAGIYDISKLLRRRPYGDSVLSQLFADCRVPVVQGEAMNLRTGVQPAVLSPQPP